jgi:hypothetical protein
MLNINTKIVEESKLSLSQMVSYLRHHGWQQVQGKNNQLMVFQGIKDNSGNPLLLILPRNEVAEDALRYLSHALRLLADIEDCSLEEMLDRIQGSVVDEKIIPSDNELSGYVDFDLNDTLPEVTLDDLVAHAEGIRPSIIDEVWNEMADKTHSKHSP